MLYLIPHPIYNYLRSSSWIIFLPSVSGFVWQTSLAHMLCITCAVISISVRCSLPSCQTVLESIPRATTVCQDKKNRFIKPHLFRPGVEKRLENCRQVKTLNSMGPNQGIITRKRNDPVRMNESSQDNNKISNKFSSKSEWSTLLVQPN